MTRDEWIESMVEYMTRWLTLSDGVAFTAEYFAQEALLNHYPEPNDARDWGGVFSRAKRRGLIKVLTVDGQPATATTAAHHRTPLWVRA